MISLEEAKARVLSASPVVEPVLLAVRDALGCVTAAPVVAREAIPPFDNTALDGYAVRAIDTEGAPVRLRVVDEIRAGEAPQLPVGPGEAIRIMTGAPMPPGADAIVMVELTEAEGEGRDVVLIKAAVEKEEGLRHAGDDVHPGDVVIQPGVELGPTHLGVLSSLGLSEVLAYPKLRVGVFSSGDELVGDGSPLKAGQIRDTNTEMLLALVARADCVPVNLGIVRDQEAALTDAIVDGIARCDALITSGGVSMGDYDYVKVVLDRLGEMQWMQIAIRPSKPFAFGLLRHGDRSVPVFGLPGNPVSSLVSFELFARPALRAMAGKADLYRPTVRAVADEVLRRGKPDEKVHLIRVHASVAEDGYWHLRSTGKQGSHQLANSAGANGLVALNDGEEIAPGGETMVMLIA